MPVGQGTQIVLRGLRQLAMVAWVGGLMFLAFVVAPVAFGSLPSKHEAGLVVAGTIRPLHWIGLIGGGIFCLATGWLWLHAEVPARVAFMIESTLTLVMLLATAYSQFNILPRMDADQAAAGGDVDTVATTNAARVDFERLHVLSERVEGLVLLCGLGVVVMLARESMWPETGKIKTL